MNKNTIVSGKGGRGKSRSILSPMIPVIASRDKGYKGRKSRFKGFLTVREVFFIVTIDAFVISRHTREGGYPGAKKRPEMTGFPFPRE
jgi:hypothetical protein